MSLVLIDLVACPACGGELDSEQVDEDALLRHGGYGATRTSVRFHCACGWTLLRQVSETRPPRLS